MRCHACDKPLTSDEARECFDSCFACERERHAGRLAYHIQQERITRARVIELIDEALGKDRKP